MSEKLRLQREQIKNFVGDDPDAIRVIEKLLKTVNDFSNIKVFPPGMLITQEIATNTTSPCGTDTWCTTPLNTLRYNSIENATADVVTNNDFTLPAGTYLIRFRQQFMRTQGSYARIYDVTAGQALIYSSGSWSHNSSGGTPISVGEGYITLTQDSTLRLEHFYNVSSSFEIGYYPSAGVDGEVIPSMVHILQISERAQTVTYSYEANTPPTMIVEDQKASETDGGTLTKNTWNTRDLNTVVLNEISGASLASNQITLPAGAYEIRVSAPAYLVGQHMARLQNTTAGTTPFWGTSEFTWTSSNVTTHSFIEGRLTLGAESILELQHNCRVTNSGSGGGSSVGEYVTGGVDHETYSRVVIKKVS